MLSAFATVLLVSSLLIIVADGATLPIDEVNALKQIAKTMGNKDWDFSVDPCSGTNGWNDFREENAVTCNCSHAGDNICHVVSIMLKERNLAGTVPNLVALPYLREIDLTRNYLNGTIPREWGSMQLVNISLLGNRVTGSLPKELANISTLVSLVLEYNQLSGSIPPEFGNFSSIERLFLTSNNLTGELPPTLANLRTLKDFRIGDNQFTGSIPNFIQNWLNIEKLVIQGSGLSGPFPAGIALLTNLKDLRISDLKGNDSTFPYVGDAQGMSTLILRSCNIVGRLPDYIGTMIGLKVLDLSFNKLTGNISNSYAALSEVDRIYFTGNMLTGPLPHWTTLANNIDLSYNNLSTEGLSCQTTKQNLFASSKGNMSGIDSCLSNWKCPKTMYGFRINCGGNEETVNKNMVYEDDTQGGGPSTFSESLSNWRFSNTGHFLDTSRATSYTTNTISSISGENPELYMTARISPLSLTYYGFCLQNGNYTVNLHFAEFMFSDNQSFSSLGKRIFDVYIQGERVLKDFNIVEAAGGVSKAIIMKFVAVVADTTLDIRFYWAGKGTIALPVRGTYGPLISAISVDPNFPVPSEGGNSMSVGSIVAIVIGFLLVISLVLGVVWWKCCRPRKYSREIDLKGLDLHTGSFTLRQIKAATNDFDSANKIGEGGFGSVYKGVLLDGTFIAVKQLSSKSKQGNREFLNEIGMISAIQHPNLVKLYGCCIEGNQLLLVYEYMENNSLARALFGPKEFQLTLDWATRHKICIGIARGLAYLHEESRLKIVHRDIKGTNVLLDKNFDPKISDFGLAKLDEEDNTHMSTRIAGTYGYMAPEYAMRGYLTDKADVYSFGIVTLEIVSGRINSSFKSKEDSFYLLDWALVLKEKENLMELVDPRLENDLNKEEILTTINLALLCTNVSPAVRPSMSHVVSMLEGTGNVQSFDSDSSESSSQRMLKDKVKDNKHSDVISTSDSHVQSSMSMEMPLTESSANSNDLYPIKLDSSYWEKRL